MTVRRALVTKSDEAIKEYTDSDKDQIHKRIARCYADNPTVYLSVVSSSGNLSPVMNDTRYRSGPAAQSTGNQDAVNDGAAEYPQDDDTGDPEQIIENSYDKISQTRTDPGGHPSYYDWAAKPVYMEYDNSIREMSFQDVMDTFIDPVVDKIQLSSTDARAGGTFFISTATSHTNCSDLGILVSLLGMMGCLQVTMTLNMILGNFKKHGIISRFDSFASQWIELKPSNRVNCPICDLLKQEESKVVQHK